MHKASQSALESERDVSDTHGLSTLSSLVLLVEGHVQQCDSNILYFLQPYYHVLYISSGLYLLCEGISRLQTALISHLQYMDKLIHVSV